MLKINQSANLNATIGVFFDSFAKIAVSIAVLTSIIHLPQDIINHNILPGLCFSLFLLNFAYFWQAKNLSKKTNTSVTALPSGLQASCVFVWLFAIMLPIATKTGNPLLSYKVALLANLINAIIFIIVGMLLIKLLKYIPSPALFSGLAGSAFTWLAINNLPTLFEHPLSGLLPLLVILAISIARIKVNIPIIMLGVLLGTIIAFVSKEFQWVNPDLHSYQIYIPQFIWLDVSSEVLDHCYSYLPLIIAFAIIDAVSAIQILEESKLSNDHFNPYSAILTSGLISGFSSIMGNPFAMALFFGHYSWKQQGADYKFSLYNGLIYLILGLTGLSILLISLIPEWVTLPVLIVIGITTTAVSFEALKKKEYILLIIGIIPILTELIYNKLELLSTENHITNFMQLRGVNGLFILAKGSILFSLLLTSIFYFIMYRKWIPAAYGFILLIILSGFGLIHSQTPKIQFLSHINLTYLICAIICIITGFLAERITKNEVEI